MNFGVPRSAWLVIGSQRSWLTRSQLDEINEDPFYWHWDVSPHCEEGDVLFFYYVEPTKSVCFVAHAACAPFFECMNNVRADIDPCQWWVGLRNIVSINPIPFADLCKATGEALNLRGQSGKLLRADAANQLLSSMRIAHPSDVGIHSTIRTPVRRVALPHAGAMGLGELAGLSSGLLRLESEVEEYIVDPMLRITGLTEGPFSVERQVRVGRGLADRVVYQHGVARCVIEVKRRIRHDRSRNWLTCVDVAQAAGYADRLKTPFLLVDCNVVAAFDPGTQSPRFELDRHALDADALGRLRAFIAR